MFQPIAQSFQMVKWILIPHFKAEIPYKPRNIFPKNSFFFLNASAGASASVTAGLGASTRLGWTVQKKLTMDKQMNGRMDI